MTPPVHELPEEIVLAREEYRLLPGTLEAALDLLDGAPAKGRDVVVRDQVEGALRLLLARIWPYLDELDDED